MPFCHAGSFAYALATDLFLTEVSMSNTDSESHQRSWNQESQPLVVFLHILLIYCLTWETGIFGINSGI